MIKFKTLNFNEDLEDYKKIENADVQHISLGYNTKIPDLPFISILDANLQDLGYLEEYLNASNKRSYKENLYFASFGFLPQLAIKNFELFQNGSQHIMNPSLEESNGFFLYNHQVEHFYDFTDSYPSPLINQKLKFRRDLNKKSDMNAFHYLKIGNQELSKYIQNNRLFDFTFYARVKGAYRLAGINI